MTVAQNIEKYKFDGSDFELKNKPKKQSKIENKVDS